MCLYAICIFVSYSEVHFCINNVVIFVCEISINLEGHTKTIYSINSNEHGVGK